MIILVIIEMFCQNVKSVKHPRGNCRSAVGCTQAVLMDNFAKIRAPVCIQGEVMAIFARVRRIFAKLSMRISWVHAKSHTTLAHVNTHV